MRKWLKRGFYLVGALGVVAAVVAFIVISIVLPLMQLQQTR